MSLYKYAVSLKSAGLAISDYGITGHEITIFVAWTAENGKTYVKRHIAWGSSEDTGFVDLTTDWMDVPTKAVTTMFQLANRTLGFKVGSAIISDYAEFEFSEYISTGGFLRKNVISGGEGAQVRIFGRAVGEVEISDWFDQSDVSVWQVTSLPDMEKRQERHGIMFN